MKKKIFKIIILICISVSLVGCFNYMEINNITFVTSVIFDIDEYDNTIMYLDCVAPYRNANESSDKGKRIVFEGRGKTALEAMRKVNVDSSNDLNFSQVRAYIFTENVLLKGVDKYLDLIENNQQLSYKTYMFAYFGDIEALLDVHNNDEEYLGLYLDNLIEMNKKNAQVISSNVSDYITNSIESPNICTMSMIDLKQDLVEKKILLDGAVVMQDNRMIDTMNLRDTLAYNLLTNKNLKEGTFQVTNPNNAEQFISLDILDNYNKQGIRIENDIIYLDEYIRVRTSIGEVQGNYSIDDSTMNTIKEEQEEKLQKVFIKLFEEYRDKGIDILRIKELIDRYYPNYNSDDYLSKVKIIPEIEIIIDGRSISR